MSRLEFGIALVGALVCMNCASSDDETAKDGVSAGNSGSGGSALSSNDLESPRGGTGGAYDGSGGTPASGGAGGDQGGNDGSGGSQSERGTQSEGGSLAAGAGGAAAESRIWLDSSIELLAIHRSTYSLQDGSVRESSSCSRYRRDQMTSTELEMLASMGLEQVELRSTVDGCGSSFLVVVDADGSYETYQSSSTSCGATDGATALIVRMPAGFTEAPSEDCTSCSLDDGCPSGTCMVGYCGGGS